MGIRSDKASREQPCWEVKAIVTSLQITQEKKARTWHPTWLGQEKAGASALFTLIRGHTVMCPYTTPSKRERFHRQACVIPISNATANLAGRDQLLDRFTDRQWLTNCYRMQHHLRLLINRGSLFILANRCKSCLLHLPGTRPAALSFQLSECWMSSASRSNCFLQGYVPWHIENTSILQALSPEGNMLVTHRNAYHIYVRETC